MSPEDFASMTDGSRCGLWLLNSVDDASLDFVPDPDDLMFWNTHGYFLQAFDTQVDGERNGNQFVSSFFAGKML